MFGRCQVGPITVAIVKSCYHLPVTTVNLNLLYFLLVKFRHLYDIKYVNNLWVQIDTSAVSSYK
jgi:hypothetical protein